MLKRSNYNNGSVNIWYSGKTMISLKILLLRLTSFDIFWEDTIARTMNYYVLPAGRGSPWTCCIATGHMFGNTFEYGNCPNCAAHVPGLNQQCCGHQPNTQINQTLFLRLERKVHMLLKTKICVNYSIMWFSKIFRWWGFWINENGISKINYGVLS